MARPGYVKARNDLYDAQTQFMNLETALSNVEMTRVNGQRLIPELIEIHREQLTSSLESARKQLADAEAAFAKFNYKASTDPAPRKYFDMHLNACVSMTADTFAAMRVEQKKQGISTSALIRQALEHYLKAAE